MPFIGREDIIGVDEILYNAAELVLPDTLNTGLEALHFLCGGVDAALRNWADGRPDATIVGAPVEKADSLGLSGAGLLELGASEPRVGTMLVVSRSTSDYSTNNRPIFMGTNDGASTQVNGASVFANDAGTIRGAATYGNGSAYALVVAILAETPATWAVREIDFDDVDVTIRNLTAGTFATSTPGAGYTRYSQGRKVRVGAAYNAGLAGPNDVAFAAMWSRRLSATERATMYAWLKRAMTTEGLAV